MFIRTTDIPEEATAHGKDYPSKKRVIVGRGVMPQVMQLAISVTHGPVNSRDFDPREGHLHPTAWEWYYILSGEATFHVGNEIHEARPGDWVGVPPNTTHWTIVPDGVKLRMLYSIVATD